MLNNYNQANYTNKVETMTDKEAESLEIGRKIAAFEASGGKVKIIGNGQSESSKTLKDKNNEKWVISQDKKAANK